MPVKLAQGALLEVQLGGGEVVALGQIGNDLLADPATVVDVGLALAEAPLQALDVATISGLTAEVVGVLQVEGEVGEGVRLWQWNEVIITYPRSDRPSVCHRWVGHP